MDRGAAEALDRADPLAAFRDEFDVPGGGALYMDGNSLGRPPAAVIAAVSRAVEEWRTALVGGWASWVDLPEAVGDRLGRLLGAGPGQMLVCDSTTVNLYKLASAVVADRPRRATIITEAGDFPTDRYVLQGIAEATGRRLVLLDPEPDGSSLLASLEAVLDSDTALVCLSHVHYRSARRVDPAAVTAAVHRAGGLVLWDLAHSAGAVPVDLDGWDVDLAVGCTYKYLNAGPGAPGFLYVNRKVQDRLRQPIWGWFGNADQFQMAPDYRPAPGVGSYLTGTPSVVGLQAVAAALEVIERAGVAALWEKSQRLTDLLVRLIDDLLVPIGASLASPPNAGDRGCHVSVAHPLAWPWCRALVERDRVVADFRTPDAIRLGPAPLYTRFVDCYDAVEAMREVFDEGFDTSSGRRRVT